MIDVLKERYPSLEFTKLKADRFLVTCRCKIKDVPHRRVFEVNEWTDKALKLVTEDLDYHINEASRQT